jgi:Tfp pilus assembly protein PilV
VRNQRGFYVIEALVSTLAAGIIFLGLLSAYLATTRTFAQSSSQVALQRQGTLALQEIGQRARSGMAPFVTAVICRGHANSIQVTIPADANFPNGTVCYYAGSSGELWQASTTTGAECTATTCWDLLTEKLEFRPPGWTGVSLWTQPTPASPDPRCPVAAGPCFVMKAAIASPGCQDDTASPTQACVAFTITDGMNVMPFSISLSCVGRNCS